MNEYVVDLELGKELKRNGFPQDTNFYHEIYKERDFGVEILLVNHYKFDGWQKDDKHTFISAPISEEILKELSGKSIHSNYPNLRIEKMGF